MSEIKSHKITPDVLRREYVRIASVQQQLAALVGHEKATQLYAQTLGHIFASARKGKQQPEPVWVDKGKQQPGTPVLSTHDAASKRQQLLVKAAPRQQQQQSDLDINRDLLHQRPMPSTLSTELQQIGRWGVRVHVSHTNVQPTDRLFMRFVAGMLVVYICLLCICLLCKTTLVQHTLVNTHPNQSTEPIQTQMQTYYLYISNKTHQTLATRNRLLRFVRRWMCSCHRARTPRRVPFLC